MSKEIITVEVAQAIQKGEIEYALLLHDMDLIKPKPRAPTKNEIQGQRFIEMKLRDTI
jgi:hypothetical protein